MPTTPKNSSRAATRHAADSVLRTHQGAKLLVADWPAGVRGAMLRSASGLGRLAGWCLGVGEQTIKGEHVTDSAGHSPAQLKLADRLDTGRWPTAPLRIGVRAGHELSRRVQESPGSGGVEFVRVPGAVGDRTACESLNLDAMLVALPAGLKILSRERREREAAWFDWAATRPLSYPSVFPTRLDCSQVTIDEHPASDQELQLIRALAEATAVASRSGARLVLTDRWRGRKSVDHAGVFDEAMERLASALQQAALGEIRVAHRAAARVLSAWAIADRPAGFASRHRTLAELCARCAGNEAEVMLRLGVARVADLDDAGGRKAMLAADRMVRTRPTLPGVDNSAFVQAELDQGRHDPIAVGRVAAGLVIACASMPVEKLVFTHGDLLDEMRFSEWLVGRDQDRTLLHLLAKELVGQRRAEQFALPEAPTTATGTTTEQAKPARAPRAKSKKASSKRAAAKPRAAASKKATKPKAEAKTKTAKRATRKTSRATSTLAITSTIPADASSTAAASETPSTPARRRKAA